MTDQPASDALTVARWCWPEHGPWQMGTPDPLPTPIPMSRARWFDPERWEDDRFVACHGVLAAEAALIERGLAEEYGEELCVELFGMSVPSSARDACGLATAPLPARLRALASVVRAQEAKR